MLEPELEQRLSSLEQKIEATYQSAEKTRKYIWWMVVITVACIVLPLLLIPFAAMSLLHTYATALSY